MARPILDIVIKDDMPTTLLIDLHSAFLLKMSEKTDETLDFLRLSGIYWSLTALDVAGHLDDMKAKQDEIIQFIVNCQKRSNCFEGKYDGGIAPHPQHDSSLLYTLSAVQTLAIFNRLDALDNEAIVNYVAQLQQDDGSFVGDKWGEKDTRFSFCAVATLSILHRLDAIDTVKAVYYVLKCLNFDGGFGTRPGSESHSGQIYCCLGTLSLLNSLRLIEDPDKTAWWLAERQMSSGGLNGRPEKAPDVCYSWWVLTSLKILGRLHWINRSMITKYILACQDDETGGFADRPGNMPDPFHTLFGLAGLSLLYREPYFDCYDKFGDCDSELKRKDFDDLISRNKDLFDKLKTINPVLCLPEYVVKNIDLKPQVLL